MNRLIIIGNGFDKAHNLPTSYKDFIYAYLENKIIESIEQKYILNDWFFIIHNKLKPIELIKDENGKTKIKNRNELIDNIIKNTITYTNGFAKSEILNNTLQNLFKNNNSNLILSIQNPLIKNIINKVNWVDIENEYFKLLVTFEKDNEEIIKLNETLENLKIELISHLKDNDNGVINPLIQNLFAEGLNLNPNSNKTDKALILNFNYTNTVSNYINSFKNNIPSFNIQEIQIHGNINNLDSIIFGYNDTNNADFKLIRQLENNHLSKNFKYLHYSKNPHYTNLSNFIIDEHFETIILGHSCNNTDGYLLRQIFNHSNCNSIKIYFHQNKDEQTKIISDNFFELQTNISKHFNDENLNTFNFKIVNKINCTYLPQL